MNSPSPSCLSPRSSPVPGLSERNGSEPLRVREGAPRRAADARRPNASTWTRWLLREPGGLFARAVIMAAPKSSFLDRVLERIRRLDPEGLQTVVQRLARERTFLETLFNTIEDGVLVADETGRILYVNQAVTRLLGLDLATAEGESVQQLLPELDWPKLARFDKAGGKWVSRHEFDISYPRPRLIHLYAAPL